MSKPVEKLQYLQSLRFVAAASVLVGHLEHEATGVHPISWMNWGAGVDVFFVISGFIMYLLSADKFSAPGYPAQFIVRRIKRVVPTYWFFTALMIVAMVLLPEKLDHNKLTLGHAVSSFLFFPWPNEFGKLQPVLGVGWTLNYEMFFYAVFSICLFLPRRLGVAGIFLTILGVQASGLLVSGPSSPLSFWGNPITSEFLYGVGLAMLFRRGFRLAMPWAVTLAAVGFCLLTLLHVAHLSAQPWRFIGAGLPALMIVASVALVRSPATSGRVLSIFVLLGDASYALYLSHPFTINAYKILWARLGFRNDWLYVLSGAAFAVVASVLVYLWFEKPIQTWLHRRRNPPAVNPSEVRGAA